MSDVQKQARRVVAEMEAERVDLLERAEKAIAVAFTDPAAVRELVAQAKTLSCPSLVKMVDIWEGLAFAEERGGAGLNDARAAGWKPKGRARR